MVVSKSRSSASLTVIAPVPELMANGRLPSLSPSVLPAVIDQARPSSSPVVETVTTAALLAVTVGATSVIVMVMTSVAVVPSVAWTRS